MSISEIYRKRFFEPGYVYIAGSLSERTLKIGVTERTRTYYQKYLRSKRYGGIGDWIILYHVWISANSGQVEQNALRRLRHYKFAKVYDKDKKKQTAREMVKCPFSAALRALSGCMNDEEKPQAWQSSRCNEFEFSLAERTRKELDRILKNLSHGDRLKYLKKLDEFELPVRAANCMKQARIVSIGQLAQATAAELLAIPNFTRKSLNDVTNLLVAAGLSLAEPV